MGRSLSCQTVYVFSFSVILHGVLVSSNPTCKATEFTCKNTGRCIKEARKCDGDKDCEDNSDEIGCPTRTPKCKDFEFQCQLNFQCVHGSRVCDGRNDCQDETDESGCNEGSAVTLRSEELFSITEFVLVLGSASVAVFLIVGAIIFCHYRKVQRQNFKSPVDADKPQSNSIFDQHSNYCSNPKLLNYEVPRKRMEFIEELEQGNALLFEYDAFIIYSSMDEEWVRGTLLPTLEDKHGFKCCIHYRDFMPGVLYRQNMVNSVYASKKTVAVVSKNFFKSGFCESEFEYALLRLAERGDDSLIVIKLDDIDTRKLPLEVRKRSYIDCPQSIEKKTWETKLVKSLNFKTP